MKQFVTNLLGEVDLKLRKIERGNSEPMEKAKNAVECLEEAKERLKIFIASYTFADEQEEIGFFRDIKPGLLSKLFYYGRVCEIEIGRYIAGEAQKAYLQEEMRQITLFFDRNIEFFHYFKSGARHLDRYYFMRGNYRPKIGEEVYHDYDPKFSTWYDYMVARILENDMIMAYLRDALRKTADGTADSFTGLPKERHTWTDAKIDLIELMYAVKAERSINHGNITMSDLKRYMELMFNVDLGTNVPRNFFDICIRRNPTQFLDRLKEGLLRLIEESNAPEKALE